MRRIVVFACLFVGFGLLGLGTAGAAAVQSDVIQCVTLPPIFLPEGGPPGSEFVPAFCQAPGVANMSVVLFEPGTTTLSDQLWVFNQQFYFASDPGFQDLGPNGFNAPTIAGLEETGGPQDLSGFFGLPAGWIVVTSDVANDTDIPEPGTFLFAGTALLLAGVRKLRPR